MPADDPIVLVTSHNDVAQHGFTFQSPLSLFTLAFVSSGLAAAIGTAAAFLIDACSAGACP